MNTDLAFKLGTRVAYIPDPRITGVVVGRGSINNEFDPLADDNELHEVVIVHLDQPTRLAGTFNLSFHAPFTPDVLTSILKGSTHADHHR